MCEIMEVRGNRIGIEFKEEVVSGEVGVDFGGFYFEGVIVLGKMG